MKRSALHRKRHSDPVSVEDRADVLSRRRRPAGERFYKAACRVCQREFTARIDRPQKFCSRACSSLGQVKPRPLCERCGTPRMDRKNAARRFCGRACAAAAVTKPRATCRVCGVTISLGAVTCRRHHRTEARAARARACPECGTAFVPSGRALSRIEKYCSLVCYRAVVGRRLAMIELPCAQCGTTFRRTQAAIKRQKHSYCSKSCASKANIGESSSSWRGGTVTYRGPGWPALAESIRERDGYRCRRCGKHQDEERKRLAVDHIIPFRTFPSYVEANDPANLVALCISCHGKKLRAETKWLRGDVLDMWTYQIAVAEPWTAA